MDAVQNPKKRKLDDGDNGEDEPTSNVLSTGTPTKSTRKDGHFSSPQKKRLEWNCWESAEAETSDDIPAFQISNLIVQKYSKQPLMFRVTYKSQGKQGKTGLWFTFHGIDDSGEIAFFVFRNEVKYFETIEANKVFTLENFFVQNYSKTIMGEPGKSLQIVLSPASELTEVRDDGVMKIPFKFVSLDKIDAFLPYTRIDVLGILVKDWKEETVSDSKVKRDLTITDKSKCNLVVTLWGSEATNFNNKLHCVLAVRNGQVSVYEGISSINCPFNTLVWGNPEIDQAYELKTWFDNEFAINKGE